MASCQSAKIDFRSQLFYAKNQPNVSQFCLVKNTNLGAHFCYWNFLRRSSFESLYVLLKWCPIFDSPPLVQNSTFNSFLLVCWFFFKNLSNFVPPAWKLHNRYCHDTKILVPKSQIIWNPIFDFEDLEFWFLYITGRKLRKNIYKTSVHREKWLGFSTFSFLTKIT